MNQQDKSGQENQQNLNNQGLSVGDGARFAFGFFFGIIILGFIGVVILGAIASG